MFAALFILTAFLLAGAGVVGPALTVVVLLAPIAVGGVGGLVLFRRYGVDVDERGVCDVAVEEDGEAFQPWPVIADLRTERRGGRTGVTAYLTSGSSVRLRAPYDGLLLARDPGFEQKYFTLRHLWETHRSWNISA